MHEDHDPVWEVLPTEWVQGLFYGNGDLGVVQWGDLNSLIFTLDKADVWEERGGDAWGPEHTYGDLRQLIEAGEYAAANRKYGRTQFGGPDGHQYPTRVPLPRLTLRFPRPIKKFQGRLCLGVGEGKCSFEVGDRSYTLVPLVHASRNLFLVRFEEENPTLLSGTISVGYDHLDPGARLLLEKWGYLPPESLAAGEIRIRPRPITQRTRFSSRQAPATVPVTPPDDWCSGATPISHLFVPAPQGAAGGFLVSWAVTTYADHLRLVVAVVTAGELNLTTVDRGATAQALRAANNKTLIQVAGTPWGALCRDHWDFWTDFWAKSAIAIPDNLLENLYYLELYKLACNSRPGKHPCALQGVWTNDCSAGMPPWSGDYHLDMNLQETYWPIYATNHLELGDPLFAWIRRLEPVFERACRDFFGTPGWFMRCTYTLGGTNVGGYYTTESWAGAGAWVAHLLWCRWAFTRDPSHLREALRAVRATLGAYLGMLQEEGGEYVIPLSTSPEYHENQPQAWGKNPTVDLALVRWLCGALEEGALLLGETDELVEKAQDVGERLMYYPADMAGLQVFEGEPLQFSHRHFSHLMAIYPLETLGRTGDPDDRFLVDASLRTLMGVGDHKWSGWSYGWAALLLLRGERPHDAYRMLREYFAFISPNTFHVNNRWIHDVPWDPRSNPMTLEAGFCVAAAVVDMLLRSDRGVIRVFPGVPGWATAAFTRLRAVGAFIVSAELVDGNVAWVEVEAEAGGLCRFANTFGTPVELSLVPPGGVSTQVGVFTQVTPVIEFPTQAGDRYWLVSTVYGSRRVGTGGVPKLFGRPNLFGQKRGRILPYG